MAAIFNRVIDESEINNDINIEITDLNTMTEKQKNRSLGV